MAQLWVQQMVNDGSLEVVKIKNDFNSADLFTKHLDRTTMDKCIDLLGHFFAEGRSAIAPMLNMVTRSEFSIMNSRFWENVQSLSQHPHVCNCEIEHDVDVECQPCQQEFQSVFQMVGNKMTSIGPNIFEK